MDSRVDEKVYDKVHEKAIHTLNHIVADLDDDLVRIQKQKAKSKREEDAQKKSIAESQKKVEDLVKVKKEHSIKGEEGKKIAKVEKKERKRKQEQEEKETNRKRNARRLEKKREEEAEKLIKKQTLHAREQASKTRATIHKLK